MKITLVDPLTDEGLVDFLRVSDTDRYDLWNAINMAIDNDPSTKEFRDFLQENAPRVFAVDPQFDTWLTAMEKIKTRGDHPDSMNYMVSDHDRDWKVVNFIDGDIIRIVVRLSEDPPSQPDLREFVDQMMNLCQDHLPDCLEDLEDVSLNEDSEEKTKDHNTETHHNQDRECPEDETSQEDLKEENDEVDATIP